MLDLNIYANYSLYICFTANFYITEHRDMKTREEMDVKLHAFLITTADGGAWQDLRLGQYNPGEIDPGIHRIGAWVSAGPGLKAMARTVSWLQAPIVPLR
jgi:hypothetical protein